jgi:hypothetical protein
MENDRMPRDGENVLFPKTPKSASSKSNSPAPSQARIPSQQAISQQSVSQDALFSQNSLLTSSQLSSQEPLRFAREPSLEEISNAQRVAQLCAHLGLPPPSYHLEQHPTAEGVWSGYAMFSDSMMPQKLGEVTNVYSKRVAKEKIAGEVIRWLDWLAAERQAKLSQIVDGGAKIDPP